MFVLFDLVYKVIKLYMLHARALDDKDKFKTN